MNLETLGDFSNQWVDAALTGVYQSIPLVLLVAVGLLIARRTNAATRHLVLCFTLLLVAAMIPAHFLFARLAQHNPVLDRVAQNGSSGSETKAAAKAAPLAPEPFPGFAPLANLEEPATKEETPFLTLEAASPEDIQGSVPVLQPGALDLPARTAANPRGLTHLLTSRIPTSKYWTLPSGFKVDRRVALFLMAVWLLVASARLFGLFWRLVQIRRLKRSALQPSRQLLELFDAVKRELGVRRRVDLKIAEAHRSPSILGFFHPVILLPADSMLADNHAVLEHILRHELAHAHRRDDWVNLAQQFIQAPMFFHPAVWWVSRQISLQREIACDDCVLQRGTRPRAYALLLAELASRMNRPSLALAPGVSTNRCQLQRRINMILNTNRNTSTHLAKTRIGVITAAAAIAAAFTLSFAPRLMLAQSDVPSAPPVAPTPAPEAVPAVNADLTPPPAAPVAVPPVPALAQIDSNSGPRFKPDGDNGPELAPRAAPIPALPGQPTVPPGYPVPVAPRIAAVPHPYALAVMPDEVVRPHPDGSIEDRLDRLEKLVQSLMSQQRRRASADWKVGPDVKKEIDRAQVERDIERDAARIERDAQRAAEEAKRAAKQGLDYKDAHEKFARQHETFARQMEALQQQRQALERQMEALKRQMERFDRERERMEQKDPKDQHPKEPTQPESEPPSPRKF